MKCRTLKRTDSRKCFLPNGNVKISKKKLNKETETN